MYKGITTAAIIRNATTTFFFLTAFLFAVIGLVTFSGFMAQSRVFYSYIVFVVFLSLSVASLFIAQSFRPTK